MSETTQERGVILDASGRPARAETQATTTCPDCGAGKDKRSASSGFGPRHPVCSCGYEFTKERWDG